MLDKSFDNPPTTDKYVIQYTFTCLNKKEIVYPSKIISQTLKKVIQTFRYNRKIYRMFAIGYNVTYICIDTYGVLYEIYQNRGNPDFKINSTRADNVVTI